MIRACLALAFFCLVFALPLRAFDWETATSNGREYVSLRSFCLFYGFNYQVPSGNDRFTSRNAAHSISLKLGNSDMYLDGVHYVMSFPIEGSEHDWLVSRMDVIKLFEPILRPNEISGRHSIRGVVIDAGHGGTDNGATSRLGAEKDYTRDTAFRLEEILRNAGLKTVLTRRTDVFVDLYERAHIASLYPDYAFVSIHFNSAMEEARGLETYCLSPRGAASTSSAYLTRGDIQKLPGNDYDTQNILLASMVHSEIIKLNPGDATADRGVKRARFVVIKQNVLPAILVEGGFVSNHMEAARINRPDYRQSLAKCIARGVIRFVNVMGDRDMSLPGDDSNDDHPSTPPPRAIAVTPPVAPSGLAHDAANAKAKTDATKVKASAPSASANETPARKPKKDKAKKPVDTAPPVSPAPPAPTPTTDATPHRQANQPGPTAAPSTGPINPATAPTNSPEEASTTILNPAASSPKSAAPMNLSEPKAPTPSPEADKAPAEPDEPPTVNIYPTTAPKSSPPPAPEPAASPSATTNAAPAKTEHEP